MVWFLQFIQKKNELAAFVWSHKRMKSHMNLCCGICNLYELSLTYDHFPKSGRAVCTPTHQCVHFNKHRAFDFIEEQNARAIKFPLTSNFHQN